MNRYKRKYQEERGMTITVYSKMDQERISLWLSEQEIKHDIDRIGLKTFYIRIPYMYPQDKNQLIKELSSLVDEYEIN